jgi:hypothetical protein
MKHLKTFERFDKVAFHGYMMEPKEMRLPDCQAEWESPEQETGCPLFSSEKRITAEDMRKAFEYLDKEEIKTIIGYSRGGAILLGALKKGAKTPEAIYLVAPAWARQWADIEPFPIRCAGAIIHGGKDDKVPLKHSAILAKESGLPLYAFPECDHISVLKHKDSIQGGKKIEDLDKAISELPDWGRTGAATPEQIEAQYSWAAGI